MWAYGNACFFLGGVGVRGSYLMMCICQSGGRKQRFSCGYLHWGFLPDYVRLYKDSIVSMISPLKLLSVIFCDVISGSEIPGVTTFGHFGFLGALPGLAILGVLMVSNNLHAPSPGITVRAAVKRRALAHLEPWAQGSGP